MRIEEITELMGIDNNTFWTICVSVLIFLIPFLWNIVTGRVRKKEENNKYWEVERKYNNETFYLKMLMYSLLFSICIAFLYLILSSLNIHISIRILMILILWTLIIKFLNERKSVRVNLLRVSKWYIKILICLPVVFITVGLVASLENYKFINYICMMMTFGCEIIGLIKFSNSYTVYKHSLAKISLNTSQQIDEIDVSKMYKKGDWLVFWKDNNKNLVLFESIVKIEYYGEPKYVVYKY